MILKASDGLEDAVVCVIGAGYVGLIVRLECLSLACLKKVPLAKLDSK